MNEDELYDLKYLFSDYIAPRLKAFKTYIDGDNAVSLPIFKPKNPPNREYSRKETVALWSNILEKMIFPFDYHSNPDDYEHLETDDVNVKLKEGLELFSEYFIDLWI